MSQWEAIEAAGAAKVVRAQADAVERGAAVERPTGCGVSACSLVHEERMLLVLIGSDHASTKGAYASRCRDRRALARPAPGDRRRPVGLDERAAELAADMIDAARQYAATQGAGEERDQALQPRAQAARATRDEFLAPGPRSTSSSRNSSQAAGLRHPHPRRRGTPYDGIAVTTFDARETPSGRSPTCSLRARPTRRVRRRRVYFASAHHRPGGVMTVCPSVSALSRAVDERRRPWSQAQLEVTGGPRGGGRSMLRAMGWTSESRAPQVSPSWNAVTPCNVHLDARRRGQRRAEVAPVLPLSSTRSRSRTDRDGTEDARSLPSRDWIADARWLIVHAERMDGLLTIAELRQDAAGDDAGDDPARPAGRVHGDQAGLLQGRCHDPGRLRGIGATRPAA